MIYIDASNHMPCYKTTSEDIEKMEQEYTERFSKSNLLNSKTINNQGESRKCGILGEIIFHKLYPEASRSEDLSYDFDYGSLRIDVKCKCRSVTPKGFFEGDIPFYQKENKSSMANTYFFMSTIHGFEKIWLCGFMKKNEYFTHPKREIWRAGETCMSNNRTYQADAFTLQYQYMNAVDINKLAKI